jgi:hypothetical protein
MQISKLYGLLINVFSKTLLGVILLTLSACSPYLYTNEISLFNEGIDNSFASFEEIKNEACERRRNMGVKSGLVIKNPPVYLSFVKKVL